MPHLIFRGIISLYLSFSLIAGGQSLALSAEKEGVHRWLAALRDQNENIRMGAAYNFKLLEPVTKETVAALIAALKDKDPFVRAHVAGALGEIGSESEIITPALVEALQDSDISVREQAAIALGKLGPSSVPALIKLLSKYDVSADRSEASKKLGAEDIRVSDYAALALGRIGAPAFAALVEASKDRTPYPAYLPCQDCKEPGGIRFEILTERAYPIQSYAQNLLEEIALPATPTVEVILHSPDRNLREWSIVALGNNTGEASIIIPALAKVLAEDDPKVSETAAQALAKFGRPAVPALVSALKSKNDDVRLSALDALYEIGPDATAAVPDLILALKDSSEAIKVKAAWTLGLLGPAAKDAVPALVRALKDQDKTVRAQAASALGLIVKDDESVAIALGEALGDEEHNVRYDAAFALERMGAAARAAVPSLLAARRRFTSDDEIILALLAIDKKSPLIRQALIKDLSDPNVDIAASAARSLGEFVGDDTSSLAALISALKRKELEVRIGAVQGLGAIGPGASAAVPALLQAFSKEKEKDAIYQWVLSALGKIGNAAVPALLEFLGDADLHIRIAALNALQDSKTTDARVVPALVAALKDKSLRLDAAEMLGDLGPTAKAAIPSLAQLLADPVEYVRVEIVTALGKIGPDAKESVRDISRLLNDDSSEVRLAAAVALFRIGANTLAAEQTIIEVLRKISSEDQWMIRKVAEATTEIPRPIQWAIIKALKSPNIQTRRNAARVLATSPHVPAEALPAIISALKDEDAKIRQSIIRTLLRMKPPLEIAGPALISLLNDKRPAIKVAAAQALFDLGYDVSKIGPKFYTIIYDDYIHRYVAKSLEEVHPAVLTFGNVVLISASEESSPFPQLPWWPPPRFSGWYVLQRDSLAGDENTLNFVHRRISNALLEMGYRSQGLFEVPDGFALVTRVERIYNDGRWYLEPERWTNNKLSPEGLDYFTQLIIEPPGHYRLFMFIVTTHNDLQGGSEQLSEEAMRGLFNEGGRILPDYIGNAPFRDHNCHILVYHFEKKGGDIKIDYDDPLDAETHLRQSGLWNHLSF